MAGFLSPLVVQEVGKDQWLVVKPLRYQSDVLSITFTVPAGFETDLESIPRWLPLVYATLYGSAHAASVVHDFLYTRGGLIRKPITREEADAVLYEAMVATGLARWKAWLIWSGVRAGGWVAWNRHRESI